MSEKSKTRQVDEPELLRELVNDILWDLDGDREHFPADVTVTVEIDRSDEEHDGVCPECGGQTMFSFNYGDG